MAANINIVKQDEVYLPKDIVIDSPGFSFDIGNTLIKIAYRSKEDFCDGKPRSDKAVLEDRARIHLVIAPRESGPKALCDFIKESCDLSKVMNTENRLKVAVTGMGTNMWKEELKQELENPLNIELCGTMQCFPAGFRILKETLTHDEFIYPVEEEWAKGAQEYADLVDGFRHAVGETAQETFSKLTYLNHPSPASDKPYLPCVLYNCGSGTIVSVITEKDEFVGLDGILLGGKSFVGFAEYTLGKMSFEELSSKMESVDGSTADIRFTDVTDPTHKSDYGNLAKSRRRVFPFGKCINNENKGSVRPEDMVYSLFHSICENLAQSALQTAHLTGSKHIFYTGSFINISLARKLISIEVQGRNLVRPKNQQVDYCFVRHGGYCSAIGAFLKGTQRRLEEDKPS